MTEQQDVIAALDVGEVRIGVAITPPGVKIPQPLKTLENNESILDTIQDLIAANAITQLVIGNPRNLQGQDTDQTRYVAAFVERLKPVVNIPIHMQDEALTSVKAEEELKDRKLPYEKGDIDALAATYILSDYIEEHHGAVHA